MRMRLPGREILPMMLSGKLFVAKMSEIFTMT